MARVAPLRERLDDAGIGEEIYALAAAIYPICRSITGDGVRQTFDHLARRLDLEVHEVPTGTQVFDWTIPREWSIRDAFIKNAAGERIVDFRKCNLHVLNYSRPVRVQLPLEELKKHVFTLPDQPDLIPYRTSYYAESWGFCMAHRELAALPDGIYEVEIDASLEDGSLTYGEYLHRGETEEEFLFSAHVCHPSLANDNCSGLALLTLLAERLAPLKTRYSYRFLFAPGTIGAIAWLARNEHQRGADPARPRRVLPWRWRRPDLQEEPSWRCLDRSRHDARPAAHGVGAGDPRLLPLRLRRAAVLLAWVRPARRPAAAEPVRDLSRVSYLRRQSRLHPARTSCRILPDDHRRDRHRRERLAAAQHHAQMRAPARPARALFRARRRQGRAGEEHGLPLDPQSRRWPAFAARHRRTRQAAVCRGRRSGAAPAGERLAG